MDQSPSPSDPPAPPSETPPIIIPPPITDPPPIIAPAPLLTYAPPQIRHNFSLTIVICGLITSALTIGIATLFGAFLNTNIMGLYLFRFFPIGAIIVGLFSGIGYNIGSRISGVRQSDLLFWLILLFQIFIYFGAAYLNYATHTSFRIGFWYYYNETTTHLIWKNSSGGVTEIGTYGYFLRFGEIAGFAIGGFITALLTIRRLHCNLCNLYFTEFPILTLPASIPGHYLAYEKPKILRQQEQKFELAKTICNEVHHHAVNGNLTEFLHICRTHLADSKAADKLLRRIELNFHRCPTCRMGDLRAQIITGSGYGIAVMPGFRTNLPREFIAAAEESLESVPAFPVQTLTPDNPNPS